MVTVPELGICVITVMLYIQLAVSDAQRIQQSPVVLY